MDNKLEIELMDETLKTGKLRFRALGNSMFPFIRSGDLITIKPFKESEIYIGDVIFYKKEGLLFVHRLIKKERLNGDLIGITRGDNRQIPDKPIKMSQVKGKVVKIDRGKKSIELTSFPWKLANYIISKIPFHCFSVVLSKLKQYT